MAYPDMHWNVTEKCRGMSIILKVRYRTVGVIQLN